MAAFLLAVGLIVWVFPDSNVLDYGYADLGAFFNLTPFVLVFLIPAVTMRSLAEESRTGTLELLLTKPLSDASLVLGKFLANWLLVAIMLLPTLLYYFSVYQLGNPPGNVDSAAVFGSYIGLLLLSGVLTAMGLWASSLNDNQIVAFVIGVFSRVCMVQRFRRAFTTVGFKPGGFLLRCRRPRPAVPGPRPGPRRPPQCNLSP